MAVFKSTPLTSAWSFKQVGNVNAPEWTDGFLPVSQFPTNVHLDLIKHGKIPDPYIGLNEYDVQWVGEQKWQYRTSFSPMSSSAEAGVKYVLRFEGLDTFATVSLNETIILEADNMHRTYRVDVTEKLQQGTNTMDILFDVPLVKGRELMEQSNHHVVQFNGSTEKSRVFVRKAQYHYGWNWGIKFVNIALFSTGPELMTCGPWRPIVLEEYSAKISDLSSHVTINTANRAASVKAIIETECSLPGDKINLRAWGVDGQALGEPNLRSLHDDRAEVILEIQDAQFWWPVGYGSQPLYTLTADLIRNEIVVFSISKKIGLREAKLVRQPFKDAPGETFFIAINGVSIYSNGSNWCPADHFVPRVTPERYRTQLKLLAQGNQNTIRVWAGGVFEEDIFYDICDELGILVWQDFMFACAAYPVHESFIQNITAEVDDNVRRLRHHPCIVAWNGNNEDYLFAELFKTNYDPKDTNPENWLNSTFPARYIYEVVLPGLCQTLLPGSNYHPGSPWGGASFNDATVGDTHRWEVWHYLLPWQKYPELKSRFISEFGMASLPHIKTIDSYLIDSPAFERHPHSRTVDEHNKEHQHERKLATYLVENFRYTYDLEEYIYISQLNQAEALTCALRSWRREWQGEGKEYCGGALIWQLNSTWQVTSKALIDWFNRPKMAYYTVKRDMAPITLGIKRDQTKSPKFKYTRAFIDKVTVVEAWATNLTLELAGFILSLQVFELPSGKEIFSKEEPCELPPNQSLEIFHESLSGLVTDSQKQDRPLVVSARLIDPSTKNVVARCTNWPQPYRYLDIPTPLLTIRVENDQIFVSTEDVPVKGLWLYVEDVDTVEFSDNCIDLIPGDEQIITTRGLDKSKVSARYYGMKI
ncbi:hypothetical protein N7448_007268 [Penicillium atrosanguineum]|uniref:low-affinity glucose transporter HXT3 n=1 Tax=Penicillium atrosanguineum TaxID=1132637 RepID=UPI002383C746|nr:low-affinity glucose transporter HXT3 [Penicillium atrosanguineum]KAJ5126489.1 hypothetical protein N7448_007268 [Penicillium atrosanguineum]KAJ5314818.1 low-affinity glucose transporter HXT3 [Penicillium atrosanguineum]